LKELPMKLDVYLKWAATTVLILGTAVNTALPQLFPLGPLILALGGVLWLVVSIMWREWALIVTNAVMMAVGIVGLAYYYLS
tara:strand:+ start:16 stop:261 length:246 start_codon:yes stop_codon:yes gene_type:complete